MGKKITVEQITKGLEEHIVKIMNSEDFKKWLKTLALLGKKYSANNTLLIQMQFPGATVVAGFKEWEKYNRHVKLGQGVTGIRIYRPVSRSSWVDEKDENGNVVLDDNGKPKKKRIQWKDFTLTCVYDITQTEGEPLAEDPAKEMDDEVDGFDNLLFALSNISSVSLYDKRLSSMSEPQVIKTLLYEIAGSKLDSSLEKDTKAIISESVAYTVCQHYNIDTSEYSFGSIATWAKDKGVKELQENLDTIGKMSNSIIGSIDKALAA